MCFEFMYAGADFKYEDGWIYQKDAHEITYVRLCPVTHTLQCQAELFNLEQLSLIMESVVHGYFYGASAGRARSSARSKENL